MVCNGDFSTGLRHPQGAKYNSKTVRHMLRVKIECYARLGSLFSPLKVLSYTRFFGSTSVHVAFNDQIHYSWYCFFNEVGSLYLLTAWNVVTCMASFALIAVDPVVFNVDSDKTPSFHFCVIRCPWHLDSLFCMHYKICLNNILFYFLCLPDSVILQFVIFLTVLWWCMSVQCYAVAVSFVQS
jgi:hypothetical protein